MLTTYRRLRRQKLPSWSKPLHSRTKRTSESDGSTHVSRRSRGREFSCLPKPSVADEDFGRDAGAPAEATKLRHRFSVAASAILVCGLAVSFGAFGALCSRRLALHLPLRILRRRGNISRRSIHGAGRRMLTGVAGHPRCLAIARLGRSRACVLVGGAAACITGTSQRC